MKRRKEEAIRIRIFFFFFFFLGGGGGGGGCEAKGGYREYINLEVHAEREKCQTKSKKRIG